ncbi:MAG: N-acetylornithine carbamoyltransferase [Planctomycetota bacterium]|jgi:N-acetylornithine carbamoyltransferase
MNPRHFLGTLDWSSEELQDLVRLALKFKSEGRGRIQSAPDLAGQMLGLLFFNPSVRTRVSCEAAMAKLGGSSTALAAGSDTWRFEERDGVVMDQNTQEHVRELAPVLSGLCDAVGMRKAEMMSGGDAQGASWEKLSQDTFLHAFARHSRVPVINLESNAFHPCQGLADMVTMNELLGGKPQAEHYVLTWAWHPKALPVATPHSQLLAAADSGMKITVLRPEGYNLCPKVVAAARDRAESAGGSYAETSNPAAALPGARIVCAKSWGQLGAYGSSVEEARPSDSLRQEWIVNDDKMAMTNGAHFMHCLPIRRNVIATDSVLDSPKCVVAQQASNRLWSMTAILARLLGDK